MNCGVEYKTAEFCTKVIKKAIKEIKKNMNQKKKQVA